MSNFIGIDSIGQVFIIPLRINGIFLDQHFLLKNHQKIKKEVVKEIYSLKYFLGY